MKFFKKTINYCRNNQLIKTFIAPLFLTLVLMSSCGSSDPDFEYNVTFLSPTASSIYYTDTLNQSGESLGAEIAEIKAEITGNTELRSLGIQIRNTSFQLVYDENFDDVDGLLDYTIETTFQTNVADIYRIQIISTYGYGRNSFVKISQEGVFEYKNIDENGNDDDDTDN